MRPVPIAVGGVASWVGAYLMEPQVEALVAMHIAAGAGPRDRTAAVQRAM